MSRAGNWGKGGRWEVTNDRQKQMSPTATASRRPEHRDPGFRRKKPRLRGPGNQINIWSLKGLMSQCRNLVNNNGEEQRNVFTKGVTRNRDLGAFKTRWEPSNWGNDC